MVREAVKLMIRNGMGGSVVLVASMSGSVANKPSSVFLFSQKPSPDFE